MSDQQNQKLSFVEKAGYSAADAAANFVFMTMILFQTNFYTDVFGITAGAAATILMSARLWDAFADPIVGILADRTKTRWGKFRPWVLFTALPWFGSPYLHWDNGIGMNNNPGSTYFWKSVTHSYINNADFVTPEARPVFDPAPLSYQFVAVDRGGNVVGRSLVYSNITYYMCK